MLKIKRLAQVPGAEGFHNKSRDLIDSVTSKPQNDLGNPEAFHNKTQDLINSVTPNIAPPDSQDRETQLNAIKEWLVANTWVDNWHQDFDAIADLIHEVMDKSKLDRIVTLYSKGGNNENQPNR